MAGARSIAAHISSHIPVFSLPFYTFFFLPSPCPIQDPNTGGMILTRTSDQCVPWQWEEEEREQKKEQDQKEQDQPLQMEKEQRHERTTEKLAVNIRNEESEQEQEELDKVLYSPVSPMADGAGDLEPRRGVPRQIPSDPPPPSSSSVILPHLFILIIVISLL